MNHELSTHERIIFHEDGDANHWSMLTENGHWMMAILANGAQTSERQIANFRRLAACWNACRGIDTDKLEKLPHPFGELLNVGFMDLWEAYADRKAEVAELREQRDELLEVLEGVIKCERGMLGHLFLEGWQEQVVRDAISKVKGGKVP